MCIAYGYKLHCLGYEDEGNLQGLQGMGYVIDPGTTIDTHKDSIAITLLFQGLPEELVLQIWNNDSAKELWEVVKSRNKGAEHVKEARLQTLMSEFEGLKMKEPSTIAGFAGKISGIASRSASLGTMIK
ncbi:hypothetical protein HanPI659440_Chr05g0197981 [Helianthus annuus]|nr:hypothetical protein HanPI659440_Chr05g0197981 [Helianthus annuus]